MIKIIGKDIDMAFIEEVKKLVLSPEAIAHHKDLKMVYTPLHGTGITLVPPTLEAIGFTNIIHVPEQDMISGDFPTVVSPNPEEPEALDLAIKKAIETDAEIVMATDPDADRIGTAIRDAEGNFMLLNGNQAMLIFFYYLITRRNELNKLTGKDYIVKTIVSTELVAPIAHRYGVEMFDCYTGFKWIAEIIRKRRTKTIHWRRGRKLRFSCRRFRARQRFGIGVCFVCRNNSMGKRQRKNHVRTFARHIRRIRIFQRGKRFIGKER